jgi:hypothetical protein
MERIAAGIDLGLLVPFVPSGHKLMPRAACHTAALARQSRVRHYGALC